MKKIKLAALLALFSLVSLLACNSAKNESANGDAVALKFNLQKGKSYDYNMNISMNSQMQEQAMNTEMIFDYSVEVLDDKDTLKTLRATYDRIKMMMKAGQMNMDFDTDKPQGDSTVDFRTNPMGMMSNMFYAMKGKGFGMTVNNKGEVVSVTGLAEMQDAMMNALTVDDNVKAAMSNAFQSQFNEDNIKKSFSMAFNIFPDKAVKVGDTWEKKMSLDGAMAGDVATTYKVKEIKSDKVILDLTSDMSMGQTKGTQKGSMTIDKATGLVLDGLLEQEFSAPMKMVTKTRITGKEN